MIFHAFGKTTLDEGFDRELIDAVRQKGIVVPGVDPRVRRKDRCGAWIDRSQYGVMEENGTGWEIDHIVPIASGGKDLLSNLQPLQWQNNRAKADNPSGRWSCAVVARN